MIPQPKKPVKSFIAIQIYDMSLFQTYLEAVQPKIKVGDTIHLSPSDGSRDFKVTKVQGGKVFAKRGEGSESMLSISDIDQDEEGNFGASRSKVKFVSLPSSNRR